MRFQLSRMALAAAASIVLTSPSSARYDVPPNDYPTVARADYVFACMQVNGQTRESLERCSCSIDQIAVLIPWAAYEEAETIMAVVQKGGESVNWAMNPGMQKKVDELKRAQVEGELRCF